MASVPTRRAAAVPSMRFSTSIVFIGFQVRPNRFSRGMSSGIPSSQVLSRWMDPVRSAPHRRARTTCRPSRGCGCRSRSARWRAVQHENVEVMGFHLGQRALPPPDAECAVVRPDLSRHRACRVVGERNAPSSVISMTSSAR